MKQVHYTLESLYGRPLLAIPLVALLSHGGVHSVLLLLKDIIIYTQMIFFKCFKRRSYLSSHAHCWPGVAAVSQPLSILPNAPAVFVVRLPKSNPPAPSGRVPQATNGHPPSRWRPLCADYSPPSVHTFDPEGELTAQDLTGDDFLITGVSTSMNRSFSELVRKLTIMAALTNGQETASTTSPVTLAKYPSSSWKVTHWAEAANWH